MASALPGWDVQDEAVEIVAHLDLARQATGVVHIEREIEHVFFHGRGTTDGFPPAFVNVDMAGGAGAGAATFGDDAGHGIHDRCFHHGRAVLGFRFDAFATCSYKGDFGHWVFWGCVYRLDIALNLSIGRLGSTLATLCTPS